jgi:hypothetical protein
MTLLRDSIAFSRQNWQNAAVASGRAADRYTLNAKRFVGNFKERKAARFITDITLITGA